MLTWFWQALWLHIVVLPGYSVHVQELSHWAICKMAGVQKCSGPFGDHWMLWTPGLFETDSECPIWVCLSAQSILGDRQVPSFPNKEPNFQFYYYIQLETMETTQSVKTIQNTFSLLNPPPLFYRCCRLPGGVEEQGVLSETPWELQKHVLSVQVVY